LLDGARGTAPVADDGSEPDSPWAERDGFQLGGERSVVVPIVVDGEGASATVAYAGNGTRVAVDGVAPATDAKAFEAGQDAYVLRGGRQTRVRVKDFSAATAEASTSDGVIKAPMHGKVLELLVGVGDRVASGQRLAVIEAMKMEHTLRAPFAGKVMQVPVGTGVQVVEGAQIMVLEPAKDSVK
jgi:3-methylcrotonyl-CoA carboxylase alpha subunit